MEALKEQQQEISDTLDKLQKDIEVFDKKEPSQRDKAISKIEKTFVKLKNLIEAFEYDRIELAASSDLDNSGIYENNLRDFEKKYDDLEGIFLIKKDPNYAEKLHLLQVQGKLEAGDSSRVILQGDMTLQAGTKTLQNTLGLLTQTHQVADNIALDLDSQIERLQKALVKVQDTRSDIRNANEYIKYFGKELLKDKLWRGLLVFIIIFILVIIGLRSSNHSGRQIEYDILNGFN